MKALSCLGQHRPDNHRVFFSTGMHDLPSGFIEPGQQMADKHGESPLSEQGCRKGQILPSWGEHHVADVNAGDPDLHRGGRRCSRRDAGCC